MGYETEWPTNNIYCTRVRVNLYFYTCLIAIAFGFGANVLEAVWIANFDNLILSFHHL